MGYTNSSTSKRSVSPRVATAMDYETQLDIERLAKGAGGGGVEGGASLGDGGPLTLPSLLRSSVGGRGSGDPLADMQWTQHIVQKMRTTREECVGMRYLFRRTGTFWRRVGMTMTVLMAAMMVTTSVMGINDPNCSDATQRWLIGGAAMASSVLLAVYRAIAPDSLAARASNLAVGYNDLAEYIDEQVLISGSWPHASVGTVLNHVRRTRKRLFMAEDILIPGWIRDSTLEVYRLPDYIAKIRRTSAGMYIIGHIPDPHIPVSPAVPREASPV